MRPINRDAWRRDAELTAEEHLEAEELINEMQDRLETLRERNQTKGITTGLGFKYQPISYTVETTHGQVVFEVGQGGVEVKLNGSSVLQIVGLYLVGIKFNPLTRALSGVRAQMILDDLAAI